MTAGIILLLHFFVWGRFHDLRMRVATLGIPPEAWETPLKAWAWKVRLLYLFGFVLFLIALYFAIHSWYSYQFRLADQLLGPDAQ